jgi:hypothetical protein
MRITVEELRRACSVLFDYLEESGNGALEIEEDFYWDVPLAARYDPNSKPEELTLGQLSSDLEEVLSIGAGQREPVSYSLVWLAAVLRRVGEVAED